MKLPIWVKDEHGKWHVLPAGFPGHLLKRLPSGRLGITRDQFESDHPTYHEITALWRDWSCFLDQETTRYNEPGYYTREFWLNWNWEK